MPPYPSSDDNRCLRCELNQSVVSLLSWALVADGPFIQRMPNGGIQVNFKASPEQFRNAFNRMLVLAANMPERTVRKLAGENYARLLKTVMQARSVS